MTIVPRQKFCKTCEAPIINPRKLIYCSDRCKSTWFNNRSGIKGPFPGMSSAAVGTMAELKVAIDLTKRGYEVFRAVCGGASCDLIALKDKTTFTIEVRTAYRHTIHGRLSFRKKASAERYALVVGGEDGVTYLPPLK